MSNLLRHHGNLSGHFGLPVIVAINPFDSDTPAELELLLQECARHGLQAVLSRHWAEGGAGGEALAQAVVATIARAENRFRVLYPDELPLWQKIETVATRIYGASSVSAPEAVRGEIERLDRNYRHFPVCMAKTPFSFSCDTRQHGDPGSHILPVREVSLARGAGFLVVRCGNIMTMPGLPEHPASERIEVRPDGRIIGLL